MCYLLLLLLFLLFSLSSNTTIITGLHAVGLQISGIHGGCALVLSSQVHSLVCEAHSLCGPASRGHEVKVPVSVVLSTQSKMFSVACLRLRASLWSSSGTYLSLVPSRSCQHMATGTRDGQTRNSRP